jgi:hypothetical protein
MLKCPITADEARKIAILLSYLGYHVTYGKSMYALAEWIEHSNATEGR